MMEILKYPDPKLKKASLSIGPVGDDDRRLLEEMANVMYASHGIGLAAAQIGINKQMLVVDIGDKKLLSLVNPQVLKSEGAEVMEEGCLSVPNIYVEVKRPKKITVKATDQNGRTVNLEASGLLARALLHEIDHLKGKLIIDYLNPIRRFNTLRKCGYIK